MGFKMTHQVSGIGDPVPSTSSKKKPKTDTDKYITLTSDQGVARQVKADSPAAILNEEIGGDVEAFKHMGKPSLVKQRNTGSTKKEVSGKLRTNSKHFSPKKKTTTEMPNWRKRKDAAVGKARG